VCYAESQAPDLDEDSLRESLLQKLWPGMPLMVPDHIVVCSRLPRGLVPAVPLRAGRRQEAGHSAGGRGSSAAGRALRAVLARAHSFEPDLRHSYVTAGCSLLKAPYVLRQLAEAGYTGLRIDDFVRPVPLSCLAEALTPVAPAPHKTGSRSSSAEPCHEAHSDA
jgi:hypothetical protein